jgi:hypothetical protein
LPMRFRLGDPVRTYHKQMPSARKYAILCP